MMKLNKKNFIPTISIGIMAAMASLSSCNSDTTPASYVQPANMAVSAFVINDNPKIAKGLDSVFFAIDLDNHLIFNADSLPMGTDVTSLLVTITYPNTVSSAIVKMDGTKRKGEFDYKTNPSDTIDFTGRTTLTLYSYDGEASLTYELKVNVHKENPDSLCWNMMTSAPLPSKNTSPAGQKTVTYGDRVLSLILEADGTTTLSESRNPGKNEWTKQAVTLPVRADIRSFTATDNSLYLLDVAGNLYSSADGRTWCNTGVQWKGITGGYAGILTGIRQTESGLVHSYYPENTCTETPVEPGFPVAEATNMCVFNSRWGIAPTAILAGGIDSDGNLSSHTWAFDGNSWTSISEYSIPGLSGASLAPYYIYRRNQNVLSVTEYSIWLITGGQKADGSYNKTSYISYDGGVNWREASSNLSLPGNMPDMKGADLIVFDTPMSADFRPKSASRYAAPGVKLRLPYEIDGYNVEWNCPYLYFFGGTLPDGHLNAEIWRGVLSRLTFRPIM